MKKMELEIINRSNWPDPFIKILCNWMVKKSGLDKAKNYKWKYQILLRSYSQLYTFAGNANGREQTLRVNRRFKPNGGFPYTYKDRRYQWAKEYTFNSAIEVLVFLMAHETHHSLEFNGVNKSIVDKRDVNEFNCDSFAFSMVGLFNKEWPNLKVKVKKEFDREKQRVEKHKEWKKNKKSPAIKLERAQRNLANWEKKLRFAQNKIKKYEKDVRYYEKRVT